MKNWPTASVGPANSMALQASARVRLDGGVPWGGLGRPPGAWGLLANLCCRSLTGKDEVEGRVGEGGKERQTQELRCRRLSGVPPLPGSSSPCESCCFCAVWGACAPHCHEATTASPTATSSPWGPPSPRRAGAAGVHRHTRPGARRKRPDHRRGLSASRGDDTRPGNSWRLREARLHPCHRVPPGHTAFLGSCWQLPALSARVCPRGLWAGSRAHETGSAPLPPARVTHAPSPSGPGPSPPGLASCSAASARERQRRRGWGAEGKETDTPTVQERERHTQREGERQTGSCCGLSSRGQVGGLPGKPLVRVCSSAQTPPGHCPQETCADASRHRRTPAWPEHWVRAGPSRHWPVWGLGTWALEQGIRPWSPPHPICTPSGLGSQVLTGGPPASLGSGCRAWKMPGRSLRDPLPAPTPTPHPRPHPRPAKCGGGRALTPYLPSDAVTPNRGLGQPGRLAGTGASLS